ncbi:hypothetical protein BCR36DRAFT_282319 [Piromyces finnis]|uniref:Uncharacterized protein n=1 Tax=Piromyces finnis TaxID=1754191 RepID=A0A1Y1VFN6_9FUNG|nr:hypothetical protein BCR36DRAFT_282319 [Piromyces finnis]|eukprot:ORX54897.1 hypothetical protein BCR36DRAFT_282319 [Piromyces finnis]
MASNGHFFGQIPQPIHNSSEINAILSRGVTSIQSLPLEKKKRNIFKIRNDK